MKKKLKILISGGGTGGHIFPAISIADEIMRQRPGTEILFVGAEGRMEMERVPKAGYNIKGLPVVGLQRKISFQLLSFFFKLRQSINKAKKIVAEFKPDAAVGVGGYASGPVLRIAGNKGIPYIIQEQNSYAGITNRLLSKRSEAICVAYKNMEKYFPSEKIVLTGNPVRKDIKDLEAKKEEAYSFFNIPGGKKVILVLGGSLGAGTINRTIEKDIDTIVKSGAHLLWQTGKNYYDDLKSLNQKGVSVMAFIDRMDLAYAAATVIISRAGAGTISELCIAGKPCILVPSPNVAEDHQTRNALSLSDENAALMVSDTEAENKLVNWVLELLGDEDKRKLLSENIKNRAINDSSERIVNVLLKIIEKA